MTTNDGEAVTMSHMELVHLIDNIAKAATRQTLLQIGLIKPMMKISECYRLVSRRKVDRAVQEGKLSFVRKGANTLIHRDSFEKWLDKHEL